MTLIDQRILIDAPTQVIWDYISDTDKLALWHTGYSGVSVLTTQRTGAGTRRRCSSADGGKDVIEEITTWVDGLGYEYRVMESSAYRTFQGRLRLQAGPDGTTVQWTVSYRRGGLLGFFQDQFRGRKRLARMMAESLRQLRRQIDTLGVRMDAERRAKAGIQGRMDASARAQYQRRYAPPPGLEAPPSDQDAAGDVAPAPVPSGADMPVMLSSDPSFVADLSGEAGEPDYEYKADTKPRQPEGLHEAISEQQVTGTAAIGQPKPDELLRVGSAEPPAPPEHIEPPAPPVTRESVHPSREMLPVQPPASAIDEDSPWRQPLAAPDVVPHLEPEPDHRRTTPPHGIPAVRASAVQEQAAEAPMQPEAPREAAPDIPAEPKVSRPPQTPIHDTGEISIWEVFGVKRPSEQDNETLEDLMRSVRHKKSGIRRRVGRQLLHERGRVRRVETVIGLRVWLALRAARVRLNGAQYEEQN